MRVLTVKTELEAAQAAVITVTSGGDATQGLRTVAEHSTIAAAAANDPVWRFLEPTPFVGDNLRAVRLASESLKTLSADLALPVLDTFENSTGGPVVGRIVPIMQAVGPRVAALSASVTEVQRSTSLVPQVRGGIDQVAEVMTAATPFLELAPRLLGGDGPKNYLLVAQSNAESVGLGGSAASQSLIRISEQGDIEMVSQADSGDYVSKRVDVKVDASAVKIFGPTFVSRINASVSRPDFPTAAQLLKAFWQRDIKNDRIDGVISIDPLALARVLTATGPITVTGGEKVTSKNVVRLVLSEAYERMDGDPEAADAFFKETASAVFEKVAGGDFDPKLMLSAVQGGIDAGSIMFWSADPEVQRFLTPMHLGGVLPVTNDEQTMLGVYFRDHSLGSKIDYYMKSAVKAEATCSADGTTLYTSSVKLHLDISQAAADKLPSYVKSGVWGSKKFSTQVFVYGPPGSTVSAVKLGTGAKPLHKSYNVDLGRPVATFTTFQRPGQSVNLTVKFAAPAGRLGPLQVRTTPMVHATEVTVDDKRCVAK